MKAMTSLAAYAALVVTEFQRLKQMVLQTRLLKVKKEN